MTYSRGGRKSANIPTQPLIVEDMNMEGIIGKIYSKAGKVPKGYFVYRNGEKVSITKEEYENLIITKASEEVMNQHSEVLQRLADSEKESK